MGKVAGGELPVAGGRRDRASGPSRREIVLVALVTCAALAARLWRLGDLPGGLHVDEAYNLLDARAVLGGWRPVFLPANAGRDVLFTYLQAPLVAWLGESALAARTAAALAGTAAVPATWWMARTLAVRWVPGTGRVAPGVAAGIAPFDPARVALASAVLMAFTFWPLHFSRYGIRAILFVPIVALAATAWARLSLDTESSDSAGWRSPGEWRVWAVVLGVLLAGAAYAHPAGRALLVLPAASAAVIWLRSRNAAPVRGLLIAGAVALVLAMPLLAHWRSHPDQFAAHATEVSVLSRGAPAVTNNAVRVAAMFNLGGDPAPWRNLGTARADDPDGPIASGRPVFDPITGLLFVGGLLLTLAGMARGVDAAWMIAIWSAGLLLPSVLTDAAPNTSRAIGALPFVVMAPALAADWIAARLPRRWAAAAITVWLAAASVWTLRTYFAVYASSPTTALAFDADKVALGEAARLASAPPRSCVVLVEPEMASHPTVEVVAGQDLRAFAIDGTDGEDLDTEGELPVAGLGAEADVAFPFWGAPGQCTVALWREGGAVQRAETIAPDASVLWRPVRWREPGGTFRFGGALELVNARVSDVARWPVVVDLAWRVRDHVPEAQSMFVHARDEDGENLAQWDGPPLAGVVRPDELRPGEQFTTTTVLERPAGGERPSEIVVGWYDWRDGVRLPVAGPATDETRDGGTALRVAGAG